jgi:hypothetical protein
MNREDLGLIAVVLVVLLGVGAIAWPAIVRSRMARNQTDAAAACKAFAEAQEVYRRKDWDRDGVLEYAQSLKELSRVKLIESEFSAAEAPEGFSRPWKGYVFQVLTSQGASATGGARNYIADSNMTLGYALGAVPAEYDHTGRDNFVISNNGTIFQKDDQGKMPLLFEPPGGWGGAVE